MCGIVGYVGRHQAQDILMEGLTRLEYRGYDSSGIAVMKNGAIGVRKAKGRIKNLMHLVADDPLVGSVGIGHTRWATHGEPNEVNAHPHTDMANRIAVVHNGIIENHRELRKILQEDGCVFVSQTDTEVVAHLLSRLYKGSMLEALLEAQRVLKGSYALCILSADDPDTLYCMRKDSQLVVGLGAGEQFVSSDIPALIPHTREVDLLSDHEVAVLTDSFVRIFTSNGTERPVNPTHVAWDMEAAEKGGYAHYMIKEIHEEPYALMKTFTAHVDCDAQMLRPEMFPITQEEAASLKRLNIVACGSAYHAGVVGKYIIEKMVRMPVEVDMASEFRYREPMINSDDMVIAISQSGETADTLAAMREAIRSGAKVMALTNVVGSSIAREAGDCVMYTCAGPEISVASTKAFITQVEVIILFAVDLAVKRGMMTKENSRIFLREMEYIPSKAANVLSREMDIKRIADKYSAFQQVLFIGRGVDYALSMEAALKLKEVSYIMSAGCAAGELKHGTIALVCENTLVCAMITQDNLADKTMSNVQEAVSRGAKLLMICNESIANTEHIDTKVVCLLPETISELTPLLAIIPAQLFAYHMAVNRNCDVDRPRNLAKSVTVE